MPATLRNVAKTDTLETQRQKINQIAQDVYNIAAGGSDLATGNLKLGDGTRTTPSLAFTSDETLGIYKPAPKTIGYVSDGRKVADFAPTGFYSFRDLIVQQKILNNSGISILNSGSNYDPGSYSDIALIGGTGEGATANINVTEYTGTVTSYGENYNPGSYSNIPLNGGSGLDAEIDFTVDPINGSITDSGSGYVPGNYTNIQLTGGSGSGAEAEISVTGSVSIDGSITNPGSSYSTGTYQQVALFNVPTNTYILTTVSNPGTPPPDNLYAIDGNVQSTLSLIKGNTYRFDISDSSMSGHPFVIKPLVGEALNPTYYILTKYGNEGTSGSFVELIIKPTAPTETIQYVCQIHAGMGANISITDGTVGSYGTGATANITVDNTNVVSDVVIQNSGSDYKTGDILSVLSTNVGGTGSGFIYTLGTPVYTGVISTVVITNSGSDYVKDDVLSLDANDIGGFGSDFEYTITTDPGIIKNLSFSNKGTGYEVDDTLSLFTTKTNVSTLLKGEVTGLSTTLSSSSTTVTITDTTGIVEGMAVISVGDSNTGSVPEGTTIVSVDSSTDITISNLPTSSGSFNFTARSFGSFSEITVSDSTGIIPGSSVNKISGSGNLAANTTILSINYNTNVITLSQNPVLAGDVVLDFVPPYGVGSTAFSYLIENLGEIDGFTLSSGGNGYSTLDELTVNPTDLTQAIIYYVKNVSVQTLTFSDPIADNTFSVNQTLREKDGSLISFNTSSSPVVSPTTVGPLSTTLDNSSTTITISDTTGIVQGMLVSQNVADNGILTQGTIVSSVDSSTQITLSSLPIISGSASLTFSSDEQANYTNIESTTDGDGVGATFDVSRSQNGSIISISLNTSGFYYKNGDTITISGSDIGGSSPTHDVNLVVSNASISPTSKILTINSSGGFITTILVEFNSYQSGDILLLDDTTSPEYTVDTSSSEGFRYFIDTGSGYTLTPNITLYSGNTYDFDLSDSSNSSHVFSLSRFRDGIWGPSYIENISATLLTTSSTITVSDTSNILQGMVVSSSTGGVISSGTIVEDVVNSTTLVISNSPLVAGDYLLSFRGVEYTNGVTRETNKLSIKISDDTPNLYYYCANSNDAHQNEGGSDLNEALLTIDLNNPKIFGSNFLAKAVQIDSSDVIKGSVQSGLLEAVSFSGQSILASTAILSSSLSTPLVSSSSIIAQTISSNSSLNLNASSVNISSNLNIASSIQIVGSSGNITTSGVLKTTNSVNINDRLTITNNNISSSTGNNIVLSPAVGRVAKINTTSALTIPSGTTAQRPTSGIVENGSIRFNTETGQYEGYSASTSSWSSLGGVRDLDGNTYIAAEASIGANDNTLYFYNDGNNTINVTPNEFIFNTVKSIDSPNPLNPVSIEWSANAPVDIGDYLYYGLNVYEVTGAGTTGTSGNEPTHTTGTLSNGSAQLTWYAEYASDITFDKIANVNINTNLVFNDELKLFDNKITTLLSDVVIEPFAGKKVDINTNTSLVLPNGTTAERGIPGQGSVRFNTSLSQFEGYNGVNWTSLGGVRDVDGNTYIIPETSPGSNENILYFFNDGDNTLRLSTTELTFDTIDQIGSTSGNLDLQASTVTFNSLALTIDTSVSTDTTLLSTQDNFNIALSSGLTTDPLLRLTNTGEIYINQTFGTGSNSLLKVLDKDLNKFELDDVITETSEYILTKGTTDSGASVIFDPTLHSGAKVIIIADNTTADDREMIEFTVITKGTDIFHTEYGNVVSGGDIISPTFDFDAGGNVRLNAFLTSDVAENDVVNITVVSTVIKR